MKISQNTKNKLIATTIVLFALLIIAGLICMTILFATRVTADDLIDIPIYKLSKQHKVVVDKTNSYLGHPDLVLTDGGKLITMYPSGHGKGAIITKTSDDLGETWSDRLLTTPRSWDDSQETPILYKIKTTAGVPYILLTSGCPHWGVNSPYQANGFNSSISADDGKTWTEFDNWYGTQWASEQAGRKPFDCIVAMSSLTQLKDKDGNLKDEWMGTFHDHEFINYKSILTIVDGKPVWSEPTPFLSEHREIELNSAMCELEIVREPKTDTLILIARANSRKTNSMISFSDDEGETWSTPKELPNELTGDRHKAEVDSATGKLVISFRQVIPKHKPNAFSGSKFVGNSWVAWVGTFDDLMSYKDDDSTNDRKGTAQIVLGTNNVFSGADTGYCGIVNVDGEFILTSYGYFSSFATNPYIMCVRFKLSDFGIH